MSGIPFHNTGYGRDLFEKQIPQIIRAMNMLMDEIESLRDEIKLLRGAMDENDQ